VSAEDAVKRQFVAGAAVVADPWLAVAADVAAVVSELELAADVATVVSELELAADVAAVASEPVLAVDVAAVAWAWPFLPVSPAAH